VSRRKFFRPSLLFLQVARLSPFPLPVHVPGLDDETYPNAGDFREIFAVASVSSLLLGDSSFYHAIGVTEMD